MHLDVVFAADPRFPGGTTSATAMDIRAVRRMGLTVGLVPMRSSVLRAAREVHPRMRSAVEETGAALLGPESDVDCDLLLVTHPSLLQHMAERPTAIRPKHALLVANHPPRLGRPQPEYDLAAILETMEHLFAAPARVVPVSPVVRELLHGTGVDPARIAATDLVRIVDPDEWDMPVKVPRPGEPVVIGRHGRPDAMKWPDEAADVLAAWPARADVRVHMLGGGPPEELVEHWPPNWRVMPFAAGGARAFLEPLHFYVYFHSRAWIEAFGLSVLEALAAGKVAILPETFRDLFGEGAVYTTPAGVMDVVDALRADPAAYAAQASRARETARTRFSWPAFERQFAALRTECGLDPSPPPRDAVPAVPRPRRRVMFVSSNGVGLGHVTRLAAIARRLPPHVDAVFYTLSQGANLLRGLGFPADYVPSHQFRGFTSDSWNRAFAQEFAAALEYHAPDAVVFDGTSPYAGLVEVLDARPGIVGFWVRRALWKPMQDAAPVDRSAHFTAVIEPGDLAGREDLGGTVSARHEVLKVPPVVLLDPSEMEDRTSARRALDLPADGCVVALQLGIQVHGELARLRTALARLLADRFGATVVEVHSPLAPADVAPASPGALRRTAYPLARHFAAFDLLVTEAGYNTFHEAVLSGTPAVFVPREIEGIDDQALRARWAASAGLGFALERHQIPRLGDVLSAALAPGAAERIAARAARLALPNGAVDAARFIADMTGMWRADRPLGGAVNR